MKRIFKPYFFCVNHLFLWQRKLAHIHAYKLTELRVKITILQLELGYGIIHRNSHCAIRDNNI